MSVRKCVAVFVFCATTMGMAVAQDRYHLPENTQGEMLSFLAPAVFIEPDVLYAEASTRGANALRVKIIDMDGRLVAERRSAGEPVALFVNELDLPDGDYRFHVIALYPGADLATEALEPSVSSRNFGYFQIRDGLLRERRSHGRSGDREQAGITDRFQELLLNGLAWTIDLLLAEAHAADVSTAPNGKVVIESTLPTLRFQYGPDIESTDGTTIWSVDANAYGDINAHFTVRDWTNSETPLHIWPGTTTTDSLVVQPGGNMTLGGGSVYLHRFSSSVHIGDTTVAEGMLQLTGPSSVTMTMLDDASGEKTKFVQSGSDFRLQSVGASGTKTVFVVENGAPNDALRINDTGTVSLAAGGRVHVGSSADPVGQFTITSADQPRFELNDTTLNKRWRFTVADDKFAINQLDVPNTEFNLFETGNLTIGGVLTENSDRNAKQDIVPVSADEILDRIAALPIAEWSYIDAPDERHIGPMAQDFRAAFGLGRDERGLSTLDVSGVALAGIKALKAENDRLAAENNRIAAQNHDLVTTVRRQASQVQAQGERLRALEARQQTLVHFLMSLQPEAMAASLSTKAASN